MTKQCITGDLIILILPVQLLWNMQASRRRRIVLIGVITFGGMSPIVSFLRIIVLHEFEASPDFTWTLGKMVIVSAIELDVAIMASNAASMKAIWMKYISKKPFDSPGQPGSSSYQKQKDSTVSNELSDLPYGSRPKRPGHTRVISSGDDTTGEPAGQWHNESEEELFRQNGIKVTSSVDMVSKRDGSTTSVELNRPYFEFTKK
jgi:hypothetical protein